MTDFAEHMAFVCFAGAAIGICFMIIAGVLNLIDYLTKGKFSSILINFFDEKD